MLADYEIQRDAESLPGLFRLSGKCVDSEGKHSCAGTRRECARGLPVLLRLKGFDFCPERERVTPEWQYALGLYNAMGVGPVEGWPAKFTPAVVSMVVELKQASIRYAEQKAKKK